MRRNEFRASEFEKLGDLLGSCNGGEPGASKRCAELLTSLLASLAGEDVVIVLDDFHLADSRSVQLIDDLITRSADMPPIVIALRPRQTPLELCRSLTHGREFGTVERLELGPLPLAKCAELLGLAEHDPELHRLHYESRGNPMYLLALAHTTGDEDCYEAFRWERLPRQVAELLSWELTALNEVEARVAGAAAVFGDEFELPALAEMTGLDPAECCATVQALIRRDLVRAANRTPTITFRHPVIRQAVYSNLDPCERSAVHSRALALRERRRASPVERALHIERSLSEHDARDLRTLIDAAEATLRSSPSVAARWLRKALGTLPAESSAERPRALLLLTEALALLGKLPESRAVLHELLQLLPPAPPEPAPAQSASERWWNASSATTRRRQRC